MRPTFTVYIESDPDRLPTGGLRDDFGHLPAIICKTTATEVQSKDNWRGSRIRVHNERSGLLNYSTVIYYGGPENHVHRTLEEANASVKRKLQERIRNLQYKLAEAKKQLQNLPAELPVFTPDGNLVNPEEL